VNRSFGILEAEPGGEISVRRQHPGPDGAGVAQLTVPKGRTAADVQRPRADPTVHLTDHPQIDGYLRSYLEDERFRSAHPLACGRWVVAWEMLWCADSRAKVIAVARPASDALTAFSSSLLERCMPLAMDSRWPDLLADASPLPETIAGLISVTTAYGGQLGEERSELLRGMLEHWQALVEKVRRHEGRSRAADERLHWEDGRRLVLFTALVMVEIDRSFA
jgi:hypothetical protein